MPMAIGINGATTIAARASNGRGSATEVTTKIAASSTAAALANHLICWCSAPTERRNRMTTDATLAAATTRHRISPIPCRRPAIAGAGSLAGVATLEQDEKRSPVSPVGDRLREDHHREGHARDPHDRPPSPRRESAVGEEQGQQDQEHETWGPGQEEYPGHDVGEGQRSGVGDESIARIGGGERRQCIDEPHGEEHPADSVLGAAGRDQPPDARQRHRRGSRSPPR